MVKAFLAYVSHHSFAAFAWYRIAFGALLLLVLALRGMPSVIRLSSVSLDHGRAARLAADGRRAGTVVVAEEQTGGRGSRGRSWRRRGAGSG